MAVVIRLSITGKTHSRSNRIVAVDKRGKRDGKFIENLGFYNPGSRDEEAFRLDKDRFDFWVSKGAKPSPAVLDLIKNGGSRTPKPKKLKPVAEDKPQVKVVENDKKPEAAAAQTSESQAPETTEAPDSAEAAVPEAPAQNAAQAEASSATNEGDSVKMETQVEDSQVSNDGQSAQDSGKEPENPETEKQS